jgi:hypothetical protein
MVAPVDWVNDSIACSSTRLSTYAIGFRLVRHDADGAAHRPRAVQRACGLHSTSTRATSKRSGSRDVRPTAVVSDAAVSGTSSR